MCEKDGQRNCIYFEKRHEKALTSKLVAPFHANFPVV